MLRLMRLQKTDAAPFLASGAADDLMQQLEAALRRARIAIAKTQIGVDDADEIEFREMVAFRHKLRADDDIEATFSNVVELFAQAFDRFNEVARQNENA